VYCIRPSEYEPHAMFDDEKRIVYVIARPTGNRCIFTFPLERETDTQFLLKSVFYNCSP